ncbi:MAG: hypothetical protein GXP42_17360 [Chloroflexi bacterium]|nr:hypothetical protein [Chloroflexota bacterium]
MKQRNVVMQKIVSVLLLVAMLLTFATPALAEGGPTAERDTQDNLKQPLCKGVINDQVVNLVAERLLSNEVSPEVNECYLNMELEQRALVFERMATLLGHSLIDLREDYITENVAKSNQISGIHWEQLIENAGLAAWTYYGPYVWYQNPWCDGKDDGMDYTFAYWFDPPVQNPDALRTRSNPWDLRVQAMLDYYQWRYGGVLGSGHTSLNTVYICLGDTGVNTAGGPEAVYNSLKLVGYGLWNNN